MSSKFGVILPAAGKSSRFSKNQRKKPFVDLKGRAIWLRAVEHFVNRSDVAKTIVVISPEDREYFTTKFQPNLAFMDIEVVDGGAERADSVLNGLAHLGNDIDFVAVHDAARPLLTKKWVDRVFAAAIEHEAAILGIPVTSTMKRVNKGRIEETVSRDQMWLAQTPQVFRKELLQEAYDKRGEFQPTDEAQLVERLGVPVHIVEGSAMNLKVTTADDFRMAEALVDHLPKDSLPKTLHPFSDEPSGLF
ncbi:2-C-methyl-D-erythritol 4-phosphate cytidylyltransferase [Rubinisphaera sp.]|uniref:2-C-methyl-D-erythritol 4-phosphate cytidylyltransferase n=1 Tax=Rubinisphaera sp. TaxID=2024857 RepID=UPI000C110EA3|nr:2-C-methyl-D-erythritol 4-phosphate cytidylyltransferase [Rubinisphaera sp.]MBV12317.1 2-C-methyl-D-erythritol 4-phosphate cytidylyltransferase [Rubinisphaera sp.]HCS54554.1 2-C-methyl-D-erythritol 4-phosphate cytidylyltransferase [Planctomycetaceae bacterium]|tara:strand:- start:7828 stop:8571 length:744 start_codon:yes stop_codon:yes gene_type:complete